MKPSKKNIEAAQALVKRYNTITLSEIKKMWKKLKDDYFGPLDGKDIATQLTGFGDPSTCTLCKSVKAKCNKCIYQIELGCGDDTENRYISKPVAKTYSAIKHAKGPIFLQRAFRNRAKVIKSVLKTFEKG